MRSPAAPAFLAATLLLAQFAAADIRVDSTISSEPDPAGIVFHGSIVNGGDQTAENCRIGFEPTSGATNDVAIGHLDPNIPHDWSLVHEHPASLRNGSFAAVFRIRYEDPNGFPLHAVQIYPYRLGTAIDAPDDSPVHLRLELPTREIEGTALEGVAALRETAPLDGATVCSVRLLPRAGLPQRPATLRLVLPYSLDFAPPYPEGFDHGDIPVLPPYPETISFGVTNRYALAGSLLTIGAILVSDSAADIPCAAIATTQLPIGSTPPDLQHLAEAADLRRPIPVAVPVAALLLFLLAEAALRIVRRNLMGERVSRLFRTDKLSVPPPRVTHFPKFLSVTRSCWEDILVLAVIYTLLAYELRLDLAFSHGLCLGGDTPAHHYLFSHLRESLAHGRIVSWAPGWWCGFPMYQFYFPLPYLGMVVLDAFLPSDIAFKAGLVGGILLTPVCTWSAARMLRLPRPAPALLAASTLPLLFDTTHTMWGVNISSTMAGMISNSWSFAFFPLALAAVIRDTLDARPRVRTVLLLLAVLLSHFFTSVVLAIVLLGTLPLLLFAHRTADSPTRRASLIAFALDGGAAVCLMLWWLLPLVATRPWSVDFGDPWKIHLFRNLPVFVKVVLVPTALALPFVFRRRGTTADPVDALLRLALAVALLQTAVSLVLFLYGYDISKVFVNCRLWPFGVHGILTSWALAATFLLRRARLRAAVVPVCLLFVVAFVWDPPNYARGYAEWNFAGIEARPDAPVYQDLVRRLRNTPGRFSFDLHPDNVRLGSTRSFEALPALCGKPIVEGGIVNSALGSLVAYSVQGEVSDAPAGWPLRVIPRRLDVPTGLRHLELLGVRQFLARSSHVQKGIESDGVWHLVHDYGKWRLYENPSVDGNLVHAYPGGLPAIVTNDFQGAIIAWANDPALASTPQVVIRDAADIPFWAITNATPPRPLPVAGESLSFNRLSFRTEHVGVPHLVAVSAFPNWHVVRGADRIHLATPGFMVVVPTEPDVELAFAPTAVDWVGRLMLLPGFLLLVLVVWISRSTPRSGSTWEI